jgi:hypothetical protein
MKWHTYLSRYCFVEGTSVAIDIAHQMYFADVVDLAKRDPNQLQILSNKAMEVHHKLAPSLYECFYNTLTICLTFNVDIIIDMMLRWHCNMSWNGIDIILKYLTSYQY